MKGARETTRFSRDLFGKWRVLVGSPLRAGIHGGNVRKTKMGKTKIAAVVAGAMLGVGLVAVTPAAPALAASCNSGLIRLDVQQAGHFLTSANIRSGPALYCGVNGVGETWHSVTYYCWVHGDLIWDTWTFVRDNTTGVSGWTSDSLLSNDGSSYHC
jgi:hypothetical protein